MKYMYNVYCCKNIIKQWIHARDLIIKLALQVLFAMDIVSCCIHTNILFCFTRWLHLRWLFVTDFDTNFTFHWSVKIRYCMQHQRLGHQKCSPKPLFWHCFIMTLLSNKVMGPKNQILCVMGDESQFCHSEFCWHHTLWLETWGFKTRSKVNHTLGYMNKSMRESLYLQLLEWNIEQESSLQHGDLFVWIEKEIAGSFHLVVITEFQISIQWL